MAYKHPPLTTLQMADIVEDTRAIENIMGEYTFLTCYKRYDTHFEKYWTKNDPVITLNNAKYIGYEAVKGFFVDYNNEQTKWANEVMRGLYPAELGGKSDEEIWGVGTNTVLNFTTPLIEVALDGKTAKGIWYVFGATTEVYKDGPKAGWQFGRCGVDFVKEDGCWKIWHMLMATDIETPLGKTLGRVSMPPKDGVAVPAPTETGEFYTGFSADYVSTVTPPLPDPYPTFAETFSY